MFTTILTATAETMIKECGVSLLFVVLTLQIPKKKSCDPATLTPARLASSQKSLLERLKMESLMREQLGWKGKLRNTQGEKSSLRK